MENVRGIMFDRVRHILENALAKVTDDYNVIGPFVVDASKHGAPTKRMRVLVVGIRKDIATTLAVEDFLGSGSAPPKVKDAIGDLSGATYLGQDEDGFDLWRYPRSRPSAYASHARQVPDGSRVVTFTGHEKVCHTAKVQKRFAAVPQGATDPIGKHVRLSWQGLAPTLRAGTGSDKGSFQSVRPLHPDEPRVITVREAARLQGFPDWYRLHPTTWHSFRMIGNSVPPPVAAGVLQVLHHAVCGPATTMMAAE
jgi:DNA (cytosine-5)-methyltransferase 1